METLSVLLALCEGNPQITGGFPSQRGKMHSVDGLAMSKTFENDLHVQTFSPIDISSVQKHNNN